MRKSYDVVVVGGGEVKKSKSELTATALGYT
jgi:hypothetical protein